MRVRGIGRDQAKRIEKCLLGLGKINPVLGQIDLLFDFIPFESARGHTEEDRSEYGFSSILLAILLGEEERGKQRCGRSPLLHRRAVPSLAQAIEASLAKPDLYAPTSVSISASVIGVETVHVPVLMMMQPSL